MRGDNTLPTKYYAATAIDPLDGSVKFHILPTWGTKLIIVGFIVLLAILLVLVLLILENKYEIDTLEKRVTTEEQHDTPNPTR